MANLRNFVNAQGIAIANIVESDSYEAVPAGAYQLLAEVWIKIGIGTLVFLQGEDEQHFGCVRADAMSGESSIDAAARAVGEQLQYPISPISLRYLGSEIEGECLIDSYLLDLSWRAGLDDAPRANVKHRMITFEEMKHAQNILGEGHCQRFQTFSKDIIDSEYYYRRAKFSGEPIPISPPLEPSYEYDLIFLGGGNDKTALVKFLSRLLKVGVAEAKRIMENPPKVLMEAASYEEAVMASKRLNALGATTEVKIIPDTTLLY